MGTGVTREDDRRDMVIPSCPPWLALLRQVVGRDNGRAVAMASFPTNDLQTVLLDMRVQSLRKKLSEGVDDIERKAMAIGELLAGYPATAKGGQGGDAMAASYLSLMAREPAWAVEEACRRIAKGDGETIDLRFCPTAPQVSYYVTMVQGRYRRELEDIEAIMASSGLVREEAT